MRLDGDGGCGEGCGRESWGRLAGLLRARAVGAITGGKALYYWPSGID